MSNRLEDHICSNCGSEKDVVTYMVVRKNKRSSVLMCPKCDAPDPKLIFDFFESS